MVTEKAYSVGIYVRLSKDDERTGESVSIENQKLMLSKYVTEQPTWSLHEIYADDGWSGTNFQRPAFQRMLADAKEGVINLILCKDLSRFGRNYIEVGQFTDYIFPAIGCRFVALHDSVDTIHSDNDIMAYKNLFNEFHSRDTSKKVRAIRKSRAESGKYMGSYAPYGFRKDPDNKYKLTIDEPTAEVVRRIFHMRCEGMGFRAIACVLNDDRIPPPRLHYYNNRGEISPSTGNGLWSNITVKNLMRNEAYIGNLVQCRTGTISFKNRKLVSKPEDEWVRVEGTHEPIIEKGLWDRVNEINAKKHKPKKTAAGESNMFVGLLRCADCGYPMRYQTRKDKRLDGSYNEIRAFLCGNYSRSGKNACNAHFIRENVLVEMVVADIRRNAEFITVDEQSVINEIIQQKNAESAKHLVSYKRELKHAAARINELENIIQSLYEDRVKGTIPESVFVSLIEKYEQERLDKDEHMKALETKMPVAEREWNDVSLWTKTIQKYTDIQTLDTAILMELIDHIEIGEAKEIDGERVCTIKIYYRFVENVDLTGLESEAAYAKAM